MNTGALLLRSKEPGKFIQAPRVATDFDVTVTGEIVRATVTQRFTNPSDGWVEGTYVFPLPETAAVDTLKMQIGTRFIEGRIKPREEARKIYEQAKQEGRKASLVEQQRPNMFTNAVANIGPGETVVIQIEYQQAVDRNGATSMLRLPLVVAPRYEPEKPASQIAQAGVQPIADRTQPLTDPSAGETDAATAADESHVHQPPVLHPDMGKTNPVSIEIRLQAGFPLGDVKSPHHQTVVKRIDDETALVSLSNGEVPADRDFELTWTPDAGAAPTASLFAQNVNGEHYVMAMVSPPQAPETNTEPAREIVFVIDNSGSMAGASMRQAKESLLLAFERLTPRDRFNVIRFDDTFEKVFDTAVPVTPENLVIAKHYVSRLEADGGTEMLPALRAALDDATPDDTSRLRQVVFLTDGAISNEAQLFSELAAKRGRSRVFTVGIGSAPNDYFMRRAAELGRGTFTHIGSETQVLDRMTRLFQMLERPRMTDLHATWSADARPEMWPDPLPDLYDGEPVVLTARVDALDGDLTLTGKRDGKPWSQTLDLADAQAGPGVAKLWAREKIAVLEARRHAGDDWKNIDTIITGVALEHSLVTRLTSLVAVDATPSRPTDARLVSAEVPLNLPKGWNFEKVFGPSVNPDARQAEADRSEKDAVMRLAAVTPRPATGAAARTTVRGVDLPQGGTLADRKILIGIMMLLFAAMCAAGMGTWRHLRRVYASQRRQRRRV